MKKWVHLTDKGCFEPSQNGYYEDIVKELTGVY